jgi:hypothetical protein
MTLFSISPEWRASNLNIKLFTCVDRGRSKPICFVDSPVSQFWNRKKMINHSDSFVCPELLCRSTKDTRDWMRKPRLRGREILDMFDIDHDDMQYEIQTCNLSHDCNPDLSFFFSSPEDRSICRNRHVYRNSISLMAGKMQGQLTFWSALSQTIRRRNHRKLAISRDRNDEAKNKLNNRIECTDKCSILSELPEIIIDSSAGTSFYRIHFDSVICWDEKPKSDHILRINH